MDIEVDMSGKIEKTSVDTVLAFSDAKSVAIRIPADVKRRCLQELRERGWKKHSVVLRVLGATLFLLLREHLDEIGQITIDEEYSGWEGMIKGMLLRTARAHGYVLYREQIVFRRIGRKSPAHFKAYGVFKGYQKAERVLAAEEILALA